MEPVPSGQMKNKKVWMGEEGQKQNRGYLLKTKQKSFLKERRVNSHFSGQRIPCFASVRYTAPIYKAKLPKKLLPLLNKHHRESMSPEVKGAMTGEPYSKGALSISYF